MSISGKEMRVALWNSIEEKNLVLPGFSILF